MVVIVTGSAQAVLAQDLHGVTVFIQLLEVAAATAIVRITLDPVMTQPRSKFGLLVLLSVLVLQAQLRLQLPCLLILNQLYLQEFLPWLYLLLSCHAENGAEVLLLGLTAGLSAGIDLIGGVYSCAAANHNNICRLGLVVLFFGTDIFQILPA